VATSTFKIFESIVDDKVPPPVFCGRKQLYDTALTWEDLGSNHWK